MRQFVCIPHFFPHKPGKGMMMSFLQRNNKIPLNIILFTISLILSFVQWTLSSEIPRKYVNNATPTVEELTRSTVAYLPKNVIKSNKHQVDSYDYVTIPTRESAKNISHTKSAPGDKSKSPMSHQGKKLLAHS